MMLQLLDSSVMLNQLLAIGPSLKNDQIRLPGDTRSKSTVVPSQSNQETPDLCHPLTNLQQCLTPRHATASPMQARGQ